MSNSSLDRTPWIETLTDQTLCIKVDLDIYPLEVLFRTCYWFTDRCYLFLTREEGNPPVVTVQFSKKSPNHDLPAIAGEFCNELINQKVRADIAAETKAIRELIVAQAFAEADLLDRSAQEGDYRIDPKSIAK